MRQNDAYVGRAQSVAAPASAPQYVVKAVPRYKMKAKAGQGLWVTTDPPGRSCGRPTAAYGQEWLVGISRTSAYRMIRRRVSARRD